MKIPRVFLLVFLCLSLGAVQSFGIDFGGIIDEATTLSSTIPAYFYQKDKLSLWLDAPFSEQLSLSLQGSYTYSIDRPYFFDLDFLKLEGRGISFFNFTLGRFRASDFTGYILDHNLDGLQLGLNLPFANVSVTFGYTGLLFKQSSTVLISQADSGDAANADAILSPPRLAGMVDIFFPEPFLRQDINLTYLFQVDLRPEDNLTRAGETAASSKGGRLNTHYFGLGLSGPIVLPLYYDTFFYLGTGTTLSYLPDAASGTGSSYQYATILSYLFGGGLRLYLEEALFSRIELKSIFSSGDADYNSSFLEGNTSGLANMFIPVSRPDLSVVFTPQLGNIFLVELSYSLKPLSRTGYSALENMQTMLKAVTFFRPTTGPISEPEIDSTSKALYLGTEIDGIVNFRPFSDLGIALSVGVFIPNTLPGGAFLPSKAVEILGKLEFSFSF